LYLIQNTGDCLLQGCAALHTHKVQCILKTLTCVTEEDQVCVRVNMRFCMHMYIHTSIGKCMKFKIFCSHLFGIFYILLYGGKKGFEEQLWVCYSWLLPNGTIFMKVYPKITTLGGYSLIICSNIAYKNYHFQCFFNIWVPTNIVIQNSTKLNLQNNINNSVKVTIKKGKKKKLAQKQ
jgi:hypothetical protein